MQLIYNSSSFICVEVLRWLIFWQYLIFIMFMQESSSCDFHVTTIWKCLLLTNVKYCFLKMLPENQDTGDLYNILPHSFEALTAWYIHSPFLLILLVIC